MPDLHALSDVFQNSIQKRRKDGGLWNATNGVSFSGIKGDWLKPVTFNTGQAVRINVTLMRVRIIIVAVEKRYYIT
jgi:hypothetical protein